MPAVTVRLTRLSPTHHRLDIVRPGGQSESVDLETKSFLFHDLLHYAVETEARLAHSFFGSLASGKSYAALTADGARLEGEILTTERIVGPLTAVAQGKRNADAFFAGLRNMYEALAEPVPLWVTPAFVAAAAKRYAALAGQWKATPFGETMTLEFTL